MELIIKIIGKLKSTSVSASVSIIDSPDGYGFDVTTLIPNPINLIFETY